MALCPESPKAIAYPLSVIDAIQAAPQAQLFLHPGATMTRYIARAANLAVPIGMRPDVLSAIERLPRERIRWTLQPTLISDQIGETGPIPRETPFESVGTAFALDSGGEKEDPIVDDQSLWIRTSKGLIVCVGCSHAGLVNTLNRIKALSGENRIRAVIGGFHLMDAEEERISQPLESLGALAPEMLAPCHCTGEAAFRRIEEAFGDRASAGQAGVTYSFP